MKHGGRKCREKVLGNDEVQPCPTHKLPRMARFLRLITVLYRNRQIPYAYGLVESLPGSHKTLEVNDPWISNAA